MPRMFAPKDKKPMPKGWIDWNGEQARKRAAGEERLRARRPLFGDEDGRSSRLLTGLIVAIAGLPSALIGLGLWSHPALAAPLMIILCIGLVFVCGGLSFALGFVSLELDEDGALPPSAPEPVRALQFFLSALAAGALGGLGAWAALSGKVQSLAHLISMAFAFADPGVLETRLNMWLMVLSSLLWIFALVGVGRGLWRMYQDDAEKLSR
jgi:hypothetical protein